MLTLAKYTVILFGMFIIFVAFLMLFYPDKARGALRKAASTNFINYTEITLRMIPAIGMIIYSDFTKFPVVFKLYGWFMLGTSLVLYIVPRKLHHRFALMSAEILKPLFIRLLSPLAFLIGSAIIYAVL
jgi:hypothetical protein